MVHAGEAARVLDGALGQLPPGIDPEIGCVTDWGFVGVLQCKLELV